MRGKLGREIRHFISMMTLRSRSRERIWRLVYGKDETLNTWDYLVGFDTFEINLVLKIW